MCIRDRAIGTDNVLQGNSVYVGGINNNVQGNTAQAVGTDNVVSGTNAQIIGIANSVEGANVAVAGRGNVIRGQSTGLVGGANTLGRVIDTDLEFGGNGLTVKGIHHLYDVVDTFAGQDFRSGLRVFYHFIPAEDTDENHVVGAEVPLHALTLTHDVGTNFNFLDIANDTDGPGGTPILHPDADEDAYRFAVENWVYFS